MKKLLSVIKKTFPDFDFHFNLIDINITQDPPLIAEIEHFNISSSVPTSKMLGVHFDENLSFNHHCDKVVEIINSALFLIIRAKGVNLTVQEFLRQDARIQDLYFNISEMKLSITLLYLYLMPLSMTLFGLKTAM